MRRVRSVLAVLLSVLFTGCEPEITSTFVNGTVQGVSLAGAVAVSARHGYLLGGARQTLWISHGLVCSGLQSAPQGQSDALDPSFVGPGAPGNRVPALILDTNGAAFFDTGVGQERLSGSSDLRFERTANDGTFLGGFSASFGRDAGTETLSGDFKAPVCPGASTGCSGAPGLLVLGALLLVRRSSNLRAG